LGSLSADQHGLHVVVADSAEFRTRDLVLAGCRRDEFNRDRVTALWDLRLDFQLRNLEAVYAVHRSDDQANRSPAVTWMVDGVN
jgi:hypothetical protein